MDHVVIVGAGFGGLTAARRLANRPVAVTVVDRHNYHLFQPLLYQVATAGLNAHDIAAPVRGIFQRARNVRFRMAHATGVDWDRGLLLVDAGEPIPFDYLIVAAGAISHTFGIAGVREHAFPLKTLADAVELRDHVLQQFERADVDPSLVERGGLNVVIVGAGPTGVEVCGALVELFENVVVKDFHGRKLGQARIVLVEALPHVLPGFSQRSRDYARRVLEQRGVEILLDTRLEGVSERGVRLAGGAEIPAGTIVWSAGVRAQPLADALQVEQTRAGRVVVKPDLSIPGRPNAFVVGDMAGARTPHGELYPQLAPVAMQQAEHAVRQIGHRRRSQPTEPFHYNDKGILATVGRNAAVAEFPHGIRLDGTPAWLAWLLLHLMFLVGYRNRLSVLLNWLYDYFTYQRAARLIVRGDERPPRSPGDEADAA